jgi:hypothetical protein
MLGADFNIVGMARGAINSENANALKRAGELLKLKGFEEDEIAIIISSDLLGHVKTPGRLHLGVTDGEQPPAKWIPLVSKSSRGL